MAEADSLLSDLRLDIKRNIADAKETLLEDPSGVHLRETVWPFLEGLVDKTDEVLRDFADAITELIKKQEGDEDEEILFEETAAELVQEIALGGELALALRKRINDAADNSKEARLLLAKIDAYATKAKSLVTMIQEITIEDDDPVEVDDPDADEDDDAEPDKEDDDAAE
jgi:hypothetical protein